jgi:hypothetical protein
MNKVGYMLVSEACILRDYITPDYVSDEHKMLTDIADAFYNANITSDYLLPDAKEMYDRYGKEFFSKVLEDMGAIDDQLVGDRQLEDLKLDYQDLVADYNYING